METKIEKSTYEKLLNIAKANSAAVESRGDLKRRRSDSEDFIEVSVWGIEEMLQAAYELGRNAATKKAEQPITETKSGIKIIKKDGNWKIGTIDGIEFEAKVYEENSVFGINEGNVSKLRIKEIAEYERGWFMQPKTARGKKLVERLLEYFAKEENNRVED